MASLGLPAPEQPPLLGRGVFLQVATLALNVGLLLLAATPGLGCCPWPRGPPLASEVRWLLSGAAPGLGRRVAPPDLRPWPDPDYHDGVTSHLEPDSLECDVK